MALSFPATMPLWGPARQTFEIQRVDYVSPEAGGRIGAVTAGFPLWKVEWTLGNLSLDMSDEWAAFVMAQRGAQRRFYGLDVTRRFPRLYPTGFGAFGGFTGNLGTTWSHSVDGQGQGNLALSGGPAGVQLSRGDYVGFRWGANNRALVRLMEAATFSGGGTIASVAIEPTLPSVVPAGATAYLDNPTALFRLLPDTMLGEIGRRGTREGAKLSAIQDLIA